jgi:O-antigen/teichoic acid export membrane protein
MRGGTTRAAGFFVSALLGAGSAAVLFRHLGPTETGVYVTALSIASIAGGISDLGLTALGVRELSVRDPAGRIQVLRTMIGMRIVVTLAAVFMGVAFAAAAGYNSTLVAGVAVAGVGLFFQSLQSTLTMPLLRDLRFGWVTLFEVGRQVLLAGLVIALALSGAGVVLVLAASTPAMLAALVGTALVLRGQTSLRPSFDWQRWRELLRDVLPYSVAVATAVIYFRVAVIVVSLATSSQEIGYFGTSFRILEVLISVPALLAGAAFPVFAHSALSDHRRFAYAVQRTFEVMAIVGVLFVLMVAIGAPVAIDVVGGTKFHPAIPVLQLQAVGLGASFVSSVWSYALLSLRLHRELIAISVGALVVGMLVVLGATAAWGIQGAAGATAATELGLAIGGGLVLRRAYPRLVLSLRLLPRIGLAGVAGAAVVLIPGLKSIEAVAGSAVVYVAILFALRAVPVELASEILRFWRFVRVR